MSTPRVPVALLLVAAVVAGGASCRSSATIGEGVERTFTSVHELVRPSGLAMTDGGQSLWRSNARSARSSVDEQLDSATGADHARLEQTSATLFAAQAAADHADAALASARQQTARLVPPTNDVDLRAVFTQEAESIVTEIACSIVWDTLTPDEKDLVDVDVQQGAVLPVAGRLPSHDEEAVSAAVNRILARLGIHPLPLDAVRWQLYTTGLLQHGTTLAGAMRESQGQIAVGGTVAGSAYVHYVRICLRPPS